MKALIAAAGRGTRLRNSALGSNKCMRMLGGRHLIEYSLDSAVKSRVDEIVVVVGHQAESIINTFGIAYRDIRVCYVLQRELTGLVSAMECAREALEGEDFMLLLGDEIVWDPRPDEMIQYFEAEKLFVLCGVTVTPDWDQVKKTYAVLYNPYENYIYRLVEKPRKPVNSYMGTGNCVFRNGIFDYIARTPVNHIRGEKELPDLIQCAIDEGNPVKLYPVGSRYVNINTENDVQIADHVFEEQNVQWKDLIPALP
jgi:dTDP-glucose pyrophosphorylase